MSTTATTCFTTVPSPIGDLLLTADDRGLTGLFMTPHPSRIDDEGVRRDDHDPVLAEARRQLEQYFSGERSVFDVPLAPTGTAFQEQVWAGLVEIPYGETISYGELARRIGKPNAQLAVGLANGRNPIAVIVPCHRVIGANGSLTGYGGGLDRKQILLALEQGAASLPL
jgi:methylated-DNA-[protein]-cysteine S-methyltransferase